MKIIPKDTSIKTLLKWLVAICALSILTVYDQFLKDTLKAGNSLSPKLDSQLISSNTKNIINLPDDHPSTFLMIHFSSFGATIEDHALKDCSLSRVNTYLATDEFKETPSDLPDWRVTGDIFANKDIWFNGTSDFSPGFDICIPASEATVSKIKSQNLLSFKTIDLGSLQIPNGGLRAAIWEVSFPVPTTLWRARMLVYSAENPYRSEGLVASLATISSFESKVTPAYDSESVVVSNTSEGNGSAFTQIGGTSPVVKISLKLPVYAH